MQPDRYQDALVGSFQRAGGVPTLLPPTLLLLLALLPGLYGRAQAQVPDPRYVEVGLDYHTLSAGLGTWQGLYVQGVLHETDRALWRAEAVFQHRYDDQGFLYNVQYTHKGGPRWFGRAALGTSSGGFYNPRLRADLQLARKWLPRQQLITVVGLMRYAAKDVHRDYGVALEAQYFWRAWVAQGSVRWNMSLPGTAWSRYHVAALTWHRPHRYAVTLYAGFGNEAYQLVDPLILFNDFSSRDLMVTWRHWLRPGLGFNLRTMYYTNPYYRRAGFQLGFFKHW